MKHSYALLTLPVLIGLTAGTSTLSAQNLVPNPSFDIQDSCPAVSELFVVQPWDTPTYGTPDAFNSTCPTQNGAGHTGIGSSGVYIYSTFPDNREYMQAPLTGALAAGQGYCVSFWVKRSDFRLACDRVGAHFRTGAYSEPTTTGVLEFTPQVENTPGNVLNGTSWHQVSGVFTAAGGEDHILIGNFSNDASTTTVVANSGSSSAVCYYRVDDVVVQACEVGVPEVHEVQYTVFPVPASHLLSIRVPAGASVSRIRLLDISGRVALDQRSSTGFAGDVPIDVTNMARGVWTLQLETSGGSVAQRVVLAD